MDRAWDAYRDGGAGRPGVRAVGRSGRFVAGGTRPFCGRASGAGARAHEVSAENEKGKLRPEDGAAFCVWRRRARQRTLHASRRGGGDAGW